MKNSLQPEIQTQECCDFSAINRLVTLKFSKPGAFGFFKKNGGDFNLNREFFKYERKNRIPDYFSTSSINILVNR